MPLLLLVSAYHDLPVGTDSAAKSPEKHVHPPPDLSTINSNKLCAKCLSEEMSLHKKLDDEWQKQRDLEDQQRLMEEQRRREEESRRKRDAMQNEIKRAAQMQSLTDSAKKCRPDTSDERRVLEEANEEYAKNSVESKGKKMEDVAKYRDELRSQIESRKQAAKEAKDKELQQEKANQGLSLDFYKGDKFKDARVQQKSVLKQQLVEEQMRKSKDYGTEEGKHSQLEELYANQEREREEEERRRKAMTKADYEAYLRDKERQDAIKREQRAKEQEAYMEKQKALQDEVTREKREEYEKKKNLGSYLIGQMQDKSAKKAEKTDEPEVVERANKPLVSPSKVNPREVKKDNLRQIEESVVVKMHEKDKQLAADEKYLAHEKLMEEERHKLEQQKREEERKNFEDARRSMESKRSQRLEAKNGDKDDLDYYERMNNEIKGQIQADQDQHKEKIKEYGDALKKQIAITEEAKRRQRELDLEKEKAAKGMALDSYKRNNANKSNYKLAIKQQYAESLMKKDKTRFDTEQSESHTLLDEALEEKQKTMSEEEARKKQLQRDAYQKAQEKRDREKHEEEDRKLAELRKRMEDSGKIKDEMDGEKKRMREKQQKMSQELAAQMESRKEKDKVEKTGWMDERAKKHAAEIEARVSKLKEEILRCIRCNNVIGKVHVHS